MLSSPRPPSSTKTCAHWLNAGYRRGAQVTRTVSDGKKWRVEIFPVFAATALAAIGNLPDTIESRSIVIPMRRRAPDEPLEFFRLRDAKKEAEPLRLRLVGFSAFVDQLASARPVMPEGVTDRAADCWEILLAIADLAGGDWPERARDAAVLITSGRVADDLSTGVRLLADIHAVIGLDKIPSAALVEKLNALEESPWGGWHDGKGMTQRDLAKRLKPYGIEPKSLKFADRSVLRGYRHEHFADAFSRYLRLGPLVTATSATTATPIRIPVAEVTEVADTQGDELTLLDHADAEEDDASLLDDADFASLADPQLRNWRDELAPDGDDIEASWAQEADAAEDPLVALALKTYPGSRVIGVRPAIG